MNLIARLAESLEVAPTPWEKTKRAIKLGMRQAMVPTGRWSMLPDFLIIGAQKAGTSSLYRYLVRHPNVGSAVLKEVHYFDRHQERGEFWYRCHFPLRLRNRMHQVVRGRSLLTGEATPDYLFDPRIPERVRALLPRARLIALLRDPVERAVSHYHHERRRGRETLSFAEAIENEGARVDPEEEKMAADPCYYSYAWDHFGYARRGLYARHLLRWFESFPREQILVLEAEALFRETAAVYGEVLDFLELPRSGPQHFPAYNTGGYRGPESEATERLREHYRGPNEELFRLLGRRFSWS